MRNAIIHINGWPGSGKLTIARELAPLIGARLVDNHMLTNPAETLFSRRDPLYRSLRAEVRRVVFDHMARAEPAASFIFTDALSDDEFDARQFEAYRDLAARRGALLAAVVLDCSEEENLRRLVQPGRAERLKLTEPARLGAMRGQYRLLEAQADMGFRLDVTKLSPGEAASAIGEALNSSQG